MFREDPGRTVSSKTRVGGGRDMAAPVLNTAEDDNDRNLNCDHMHIGESCRCHGLARTILIQVVDPASLR